MVTTLHLISQLFLLSASWFIKRSCADFGQITPLLHFSSYLCSKRQHLANRMTLLPWTEEGSFAKTCSCFRQQLSLLEGFSLEILCSYFVPCMVLFVMHVWMINTWNASTCIQSTLCLSASTSLSPAVFLHLCLAVWAQGLPSPFSSVSGPTSVKGERHSDPHFSTSTQGCSCGSKSLASLQLSLNVLNYCGWKWEERETLCSLLVEVHLQSVCAVCWQDENSTDF